MDLLKLGKGLIIFGVTIALISGVILGIQPSKQDIESNINIRAEDTAKEITRIDNNKAIATISLGVGNFIAIMGVITFVSFRKPKQKPSNPNN